MACDCPHRIEMAAVKLQQLPDVEQGTIMSAGLRAWRTSVVLLLLSVAEELRKHQK